MNNRIVPVFLCVLILGFFSMCGTSQNVEIKDNAGISLEDLKLFEDTAEPSRAIGRYEYTRKDSVLPIEYDSLKNAASSHEDVYVIPDDTIIYYSLETALLSPGKVLKLDLSDQELTALPSSIRSFTNLIYLDIGQNPFETFPDVVCELQNLEVLNLRDKSYGDAKIHKIPGSIAKLKQLRYIDISNLPLWEEPKVLYTLSKLETLKMGSIIDYIVLSPSGDTLERSIGTSTIKSAFHLTLNGIDKLQNLKVLDISGGRRGEVPFPLQVLKLKALEDLDISRTGYLSIPSEIRNLKNLKSLDLYLIVDGTNKETFSFDPILELDLEYLNLGYIYKYGHEAFIDKLGRFKNMRFLELANCKLEKLPVSITKLVNLETLNLSDNLLKSLPPDVKALDKLKVLDISYNPFDTLPKVVYELLQLQELYLTQRMMCWPENSLVIPEGISALQRLQILSIYGNSVSSLPNSFNQLVSLVFLNLRGTGVDDEDLEKITDLTNLEELDIGGSGFKKLPSSFKNLQKLKKLYINNIYCEGIPVGMGLKEFPVEVCELQSLELLGLMGQSFDKIPADIGALKNLKKLFLYDNSFTALPDEIGDMTNLEHLDIGITCIGGYVELCESPFKLPNAICKLKKLKYFEYGGRSLNTAILKQIEGCLNLSE